MSLVFATKSKITAIANAIRTRSGSSSSMTLDQMASAIPSLPNSYSAGDEGKVVSSGALVSQTAHADVTPTTSDQTIDTTTNNSIKVKGDADLVAGNIKKDVEIFGVTGSYEGGGGDPNENLLKLATDTLTSVELDLDGEKMKERTFNSAKALLSAKIWNMADLSGQYLFYNCTNLQTAVVTGAIVSGNAAKLPSYAFGSCTSLTKLDLAGGMNLNQGSSLNGASSLNVLIIRDSSVMALGNTNVFTNTPFASGKSGGTLYVPNSMISSYQTASNWSTLLGYANNSIQKIEGSIYDGYYADGTAITT